MQINGEEEIMLTPTPADGLEGSYVVNNMGVMERADREIEEESEEDEERELIYPKVQKH